MIIAFVAVILAVVVVVALIARVNKIDNTQTVGAYFTYEIGKLNDETGKGMTAAQKEGFEEDGGIFIGYMHLKNYINAKDLKCELAEKATIEYKVYLFDEHYTLVNATEFLDDDFDFADLANESSYTGVKYAMIEITPTADPDGVISTLEVTNYAKMLNVTYSKNTK